MPVIGLFQSEVCFSPVRLKGKLLSLFFIHIRIFKIIIWFMKIAFVVGGSYKGFYINHVRQCSDVDILVFQEGLLYEYDYYNETFGSKTITKELLSLANKLNCVILAKIKVNFLNKIQDEILCCDKSKVITFSSERYFKIYIKGKRVIFSLKNVFFECADIFIRLTKNRLEMKKIRQKCHKRTFLCDKYGVEYVKNGKIRRKFRKFCYFSLNF